MPHDSHAGSQKRRRREFPAHRHAATRMLGACLPLLWFTPAALAIPEQARSADAFVEAIGINTHLYYNDTAYGKYATVVRPQLQALGIRHLRDGLVPNRPDYYALIRDLNTSFGIRFTFNCDPRGLLPDQVATLARQLGTAVEALEGPNEYDVSGDPGWVSSVRSYQQGLYGAAKGSSPTFAVVGPSFVYPDSSLLVGNLSAVVDYGNLHPYAYPNSPSSSIDWDLANRSQATPGRPMIATESGYFTGTATRSVSEVVQGKYIPREFLEHFNRGLTRSYSYELLDQWARPADQESNFGLLRADGSAKPAFVALRNLIGLLQEPGANFTPGGLDYTLSGDTTSVRHTLLQKSNGEFYLALWLDVPSTDQPQVRTVTLSLATPIQSWSLYQPGTGTVAYASGTAQVLTLQVPDQVMLVRIAPTGLLNRSFSNSAWTAVGGSWNATVNGIQGSSWNGDGFALSSLSASDLSYEGDLQVGAGGVAAGLVLRSAANPLNGSYVANISTESGGQVKLFRFPYVPLGVYRVPIQTGRNYHLKVVAMGSRLQVYFENGTQPVIEVNDGVYSGGRLGVNGFYANVGFANLVAR